MTKIKFITINLKRRNYLDNSDDRKYYHYIYIMTKIRFIVRKIVTTKK